MEKRTAGIVAIISLVLLWPYQHMAMGAKPLSVAGIVRLLQELKVSPQRVAEEVKKQGVNFEVTEAVRTQLRNAGADDGLLLAIERESMTYTRKTLEDERRKIEEDKKRVADEAKAEAKRQQAAIDAQRKADEDARRKEEAQRKAEERKQREATAAAERKEKEDAERQRKEDERRRTKEEARKKTDEERNRTSEMVSVGNFKIDKTEVTVAAYRRCVDAGRCTTPDTIEGCSWTKRGRENHPINCIDWEQARTYCEWDGKRLPTEAEWEKAFGSLPYRTLDIEPFAWDWTASHYHDIGGDEKSYVVRGSDRVGSTPNSRLFRLSFRCVQ